MKQIALLLFLYEKVVVAFGNDAINERRTKPVPLLVAFMEKNIRKILCII